MTLKKPHFATSIKTFWTGYYSVKKKFYHTRFHIDSFDLTQFKTEEGKIAALMHDANYSAFSKENEENAVKALDELIHNLFTVMEEPVPFNRDRVAELIMSTKDHINSFNPKDSEMVELHRQDLRCFVDDSMEIHDVAMQIFYEYGFVKFSEYKQKRLEILENFKNHPLVCSKRIDRVKNHLTKFSPKIGLYCGSFNPYTVGHHDVFLKARKLFDKVVIAQGQNPEKPDNQYSIKRVKTLSDDSSIQLDQYDGSVFEYIESQREGGARITMIRGLRNSNDLIYEQNMQTTINSICPVDFVNILCNPSLSHVSSSLVRELTKLNQPHKYRIE